jgi:ABC-type uncharacterized transport system permease subunit
MAFSSYSVHPLGRLFDQVLPLLAVGAALLIGAVLLLILGINPVTAYQALIGGAFGSVFGLTQTLTKATPLLLVGLGVIIAFRANVINIGGEGQLIIGGLCATAFSLALVAWPGWLLLPLTLLAGMTGGAMWGAIPGLLKARLGVNEILSTIMMNQIALQVSNFLLRGPLIDPAEIAAGTRIAQSAALPMQVWLPRLVPRTLFHAGFLLALLLAVLVAFCLWRTTWGYRLRAVGLNPEAARYAGIPVARYIALALILSGAFAGLAGAVEVMGVHHRAVEGFSGGYGFSGIVAALFGKLHPIGLILSAFLFGALSVGAETMQRATQVPSALVIALQGLVVLFVVSSELWVRRRAWRQALSHDLPIGSSLPETPRG